MQQANQVGDNGGPATSPAATGATGTATTRSHVNGGRFDFDDGGTYCGGWEEGKAHGHGVCTGPKGQGAYSGSWHYGFEVSGVYTWPSGSCFEGQWQNGKRHGLGVETRGRWIYRGEWTQGFKGRYGVRQSNTSTAKYEGTWANGLQDGYGSETYADDGTYQGQWLRGMRHGYGVRTSAAFGKASKYRANKTLRASLTSLRSNEGNTGVSPEAVEKRDRRVDDSRGGFVLKMNSSEPTARRRSLGSGHKKGLRIGWMLTKQRSTGDIDKRGGRGSDSFKSTGSSASWASTDSAQSGMTNASIPSDSNASFVVEDEQMDPAVTETYMGEWKNDKRSGFGIAERSDGLKYEGEWYANKKYGYGVTTFSNGEKEEGKYKNNVLITSQKKKLFLMRSAKFRERIDAAVNAAQRASKIALQKADIAISRTATARGKAEQADIAAAQAKEDMEVATAVAKQYAPDFKQPGLDRLKARQSKYHNNANVNIDQKDNPHLSNQIPNEVIPNHVPNKPYNQSYHMNKSDNHQQPPQPQPFQQQHQQTFQQQHQQTFQQHQQTFQQQQQSFQQQQLQQQQQSFQKQQQPVQQQQQPFQQQQQPFQQQQQPFQQQQQPFQQQQPPQQQVPSIGKNPTPNYGNTNSVAAPHVNELGPQIGFVLDNKVGNDVSASKPRNSLPSDEVPPQVSSLRRTSRRVSGDRPYLGNLGQQSSIDHFDHYKRPPSRDSSVDRYSRATGRMSGNTGSRQPSVERTPRPSETPDRTTRAPSAVRGTTPGPTNTKNGSVLTGTAAKLSGSAAKLAGTNPGQPPPFEEIIIRKRGLGQDIIPSPNQPKRTESLFIPGAPTPQAPKNLVTQTSLQRKKSLPDFQDLPKASGAMSREEVSYLGSARREEVRRQADERERLRANPLLYLVSPQVKDWLSRQQLVIIVLFINISLAIMFFKLLT